MLEVGGQCLVLQVLKAMDNTYTSLALQSCTGKNVAQLTLIILKGNVWFEE